MGGSREKKNTASGSAEPYRSFGAFYPFYLSQHADRSCRRLHFLGTTLAAGVVAGDTAAWGGHFFFEKNKPATFTYPVYSVLGDGVMCRDMLRGRIKF